MRVINATMPRSGSEFVSRLILLSLESRPQCAVSVTPGRNINHCDGSDCDRIMSSDAVFKSSARAIDAFEKMDSALVKIESPGNDNLCLDLAEQFEDIKWFCSIRNIEDIIASHYNLEKWGWPEKRILKAWRDDLFFYDFLHAKGRLFAISIDNPSSFNTDEFCEFLGIRALPEQARQFIERWNVVNPLSKQKEKAGEAYRSRKIPEDIGTLRVRHPWINSLESRYRSLVG